MGPGPEFDLIRRFLARSAVAGAGAGGRADIRVGPGDDCAVVAGDGIAVSVDMTVEGIHFRRGWIPPAALGYRAAAAGLSDLAAVAARPIGILASVALGPGDDVETGEAVVGGLARAAADLGAALLGGDVTRSPGPLVVDVVALGTVARPILRSGARPGHEVWVTGTLGGAASAVRAWAEGRKPEQEAVEAFARPRARTREALWLAELKVPTAMLDLSDGIAGDAAHLAAASGVQLVIEAAALPIASSAAGAEAVRLAAAGGEDYELCLTAEPGAGEAVASEFRQRFGIPLTRVGEVREGKGAVVVDGDGKPLSLKGYQHWGDG